MMFGSPKDYIAKKCPCLGEKVEQLKATVPDLDYLPLYRAVRFLANFIGFRRVEPWESWTETLDEMELACQER